MDIKKPLHAFYYAFQGLIFAVQKERNFRFHLFATIIVLIFGILLNLSVLEWIIVCFAISLVLSAELFNTAIEEICNLLNRKLKLKFRDTWDPRNLGAAAVFITAAFAAIIGLFIFTPRLYFLLSR